MRPHYSNAVPTAKVIICTNALPRFSDRTWGLWRRVLLVPFDKTIAEAHQIKNLAGELRKELPGILNWAIEGLDRLNTNGSFTIPKAHADMLEEYRRDADPARAFLLETYEPSVNGDYVIAKELYSTYVSWCNEFGCSPMNERNFGHQVRRIFMGVDRKRLGSGDREWVYMKLRPVDVPSVPSASYFKRTEISV